jgi:HEAT repeat protein
MTDVTLLLGRLQDPGIARRRDAARELGRSGDPAATGPLGAALNDPHPGVRCEVVQALGHLGDSAAVPFLVAALRDAEPEIRAAAIAALGKIRDPAAVDPLVLCLGDKDLAVRIGAVEVLGKLGNYRVLPRIEAMEQDRFSEVRDAAGVAIARIRKKKNGNESRHSPAP